MFNVGGGELILIFLVALIFLGPQRLPDAARQVGKFMTEMRRMSSGFQSELRNALDEPMNTISGTDAVPRRPARLDRPTPGPSTVIDAEAEERTAAALDPPPIVDPDDEPTA